MDESPGLINNAFSPPYVDTMPLEVCGQVKTDYQDMLRQGVISTLSLAFGNFAHFYFGVKTKRREMLLSEA